MEHVPEFSHGSLLSDRDKHARMDPDLSMYRSIVLNIPDPLLLVDPACRVLVANNAYLHACRRNKSEVIDRNLEETAEPDLWAGIREPLRKALAGRPAEVRIRARFRASSPVRLFKVSLVPRPGDDGTGRGTIVIFHDIGNLNRAEEKLLDQEQLLAVLHSIPDGIYVANRNYEIEYANPVLIREFGPVNGRKCYQYMQRRSSPCPGCQNDAIFSGKTICRRVYCATCDKEFEICSAPLQISGDHQTKMVFLRDITERVRMEEDLRKTNDLLKSIINNTSALISVKDLSGRYLLVNRQFNTLFSLSRREVIGSTDFEIFPVENARRFRENDQQVLSEKRIIRFEEEVPRDGRLHTYLSIKFPLNGSDGSPYAVGTISTDITRRVHAEQDLEEKNEQFYVLINTSPDIICFKDYRGRWLLANQAILELFEISAIDYRGRTDDELGEYSPFYRQALEHCRKTDEICWQNKKVTRRDEIILRPDGTTKVYDVLKIPLFHADGRRKGLVILGRDVSERVKAEEELRAEKERSDKTNITLKVLLEQYQYIGREAEKQMSDQLKTLIFPYLDHLIAIIEDERARELLNIISANIQSLAASCTEKRSIKDKRLQQLTPRETLIVNLIQQGKSSRDIARILNLSKRTVDVYRQNIRKKLDLTNNRIKLADYLRLLGPGN